jgi:alpha-D-xyloside xylohydrolase
MAATLRGGLSLGLCGFTFWSHDCGGFAKKTPPELYLRWLAMGVLTSHTRCHGSPPKEPWHFGEEFTNRFRQIVELKYRLMPYILDQARKSSTAGYPMMRPLFFEYPNDSGSWLIEDEYFFGDHFLVAPLMEQGDGRALYLPPGDWIDFQSEQTYGGGRWHHIHAGAIPIVLLHRAGVNIPQGPVGLHV